LSLLQPKIELKVKERLVPIIEGILQDSGYEEAAVNIMNNGLIPSLPGNVTVEVPARVHRKGIEGVAFPDYPRALPLSCAITPVSTISPPRRFSRKARTS